MRIRYEQNNIMIDQISDFDVEQTLECGQCFHFKKIGEKEYGISAFHKLLHIKQEGEQVRFYHTSPEEFEKIWRGYFDLDRDYGGIKAHLLRMDNSLLEAVETMKGVRILKQEFFETLISFIISQNKQIPHIKKIVAELSYRYGDYLGELAGEKFYAFPSVKQLAVVTQEELRDCKTGFRAPYIADAVKKAEQGLLSETALKEADLETCEKMLTQIKGVGNKVANCVMLFGLEKREAFPVDVWIKRVMEQIYFEGKDTAKEVILDFAKERFGVYGGYAQQYLFYYGKTVKMGTDRGKIIKNV